MKKEYVFLRMVTLVSILIFLGSVPSNAEEVRGVTKDTIKIGLILDQTGPIQFLTGPVTEAMRIYFRHINDQGGINGRKIKFIVEDDRYSIPMAVAAFKKLLLKDNVFAMLGMGGTGQTKALWSQIEKERVPCITVSLADAQVKPIKQYLFTPVASYEDEIRIIFNYIVNVLKAKNPRIALVTLEIDYGKIGFAAAEKEAKSFGLKIVDKELVTLGALEANTQVMSLKKAQPDYVILHLEPAAGAAVVRDAYKLGFKTQWIGTYYTTSEDLLRVSRKAAEGFIGVHSYNSWYEDTPGMAELRKITLKYKPGTEKPFRPKYYVQGWVDAMIMSEGIRKVGKDLTPETLVKGIESIKDFDTKGLCGLISYGPNRHKGNESCRFYKADIDKSILVPITDWIEPATQ
jgi:branched-chain amino acid transport system substrate-binding protein